MADEAPQKKVRININVAAVIKLAAALGALAAAINGYVQIRKDQNNLLEVLSDKVDAIVLKVAYLEGRVDGLNAKDATEEAIKRVMPAPVLPKINVKPPEPMPPASPEPSSAPAVVKADAKLYRQMPRNFEALQMVIEQKVEDLGRAVEAAPPESNP